MPSPTRPGWLVSSRTYGWEPFVPWCMASEPTPSRLVGKRRSITSKPTISTLSTVMSGREPIVVVEGVCLSRRTWASGVNS